MEPITVKSWKVPAPKAEAKPVICPCESKAYAEIRGGGNPEPPKTAKDWYYADRTMVHR